MIIAPSTIECQIYYTLGATPLEGLKKYTHLGCNKSYYSTLDILTEVFSYTPASWIFSHIWLHFQKWCLYLFLYV